MPSKLKVGLYCLAEFDGNLYPAIYLFANGMDYVVFIRHLDMVIETSKITDYEPTDLVEKCEEIFYRNLESPAYFRVGTSLLFKWGKNSYDVSTGKKVKVNSSALCDKITATLSL